ncbi:MAG: Fic family protein [Beijerinckiaceae bacterium]|nr:Fic family protein [Beijerinckiaceae bacterium]
MVVLEENDPELFERVQEHNLIRQYDLLTNCIEIGLKQGPGALDKYTIWALNHVAVANISQFGGRFREEPIYLEHHIPPHFREVPELMDRLLSTIHENWFLWSPTELAAYGLWRLNWIHPFIEGNGRTARAVCYYLLCARTGNLLPGRKIVPERIRDDRQPYFRALKECDIAWEAGKLDLSSMEDFLAGLLQAQLEDDGLTPEFGTGPAQPYLPNST